MQENKHEAERKPAAAPLNQLFTYTVAFWVNDALNDSWKHTHCQPGNHKVFLFEKKQTMKHGKGTKKLCKNPSFILHENV